MDAIRILVVILEREKKTERKPEVEENRTKKPEENKS